MYAHIGFELTWETCSTDVLPMFIINDYLHFVLALWGASIVYRSKKDMVSTLKILPEAFGVSSAGPTPVRLPNLQLIFKYLKLFFTLVVMELEDMV